MPPKARKTGEEQLLGVAICSGSREESPNHGEIPNPREHPEIFHYVERCCIFCIRNR